MGSIAHWIEQGLAPCSEGHQAYLKSRGVDQNTSISFYTWKCPSTPSPCQKFTLNFGTTGKRIEGHLIAPIYSPRGSLIGFEARDFDEAGRKKGSWLKSKFESLGARVYLPKYRGKDPNQVWKKGGLSMLRRMFC